MSEERKKWRCPYCDGLNDWQNETCEICGDGRRPADAPPAPEPETRAEAGAVPAAEPRQAGTETAAETTGAAAETTGAAGEPARRRHGALIACLLIAAIAAGALFYVRLVRPGGIYNRAINALNAGNYEEAVSLFSEVSGFRDADAMLDSAKSARYQVGSTVAFGHYEQDGNAANGPEVIEWLVLANNGMRVTMISAKALDCRPYNSPLRSVNWGTCTLRKWLNDDFLTSAFSAGEQSRLETVNLEADRNPVFPTNPGNGTQDRVFLLSIREAQKYFPTDSVRACRQTNFAKALGPSQGDGGACWWWLRTPGDSGESAARVRDDGSIDDNGSYVYLPVGGIRPVIALRIQS